MTEHTLESHSDFQPEIPAEDQHHYPGGSFEAFSATISGAAAAAYDRAAVEKGVDPAIVHTTQSCGTISRELHDELASVDIATGFRGYPWLRWTAHYHLDTGDATPEPVVIDAAYQQFLDEPDTSANLPKVMVVPRAQVRRALVAYGVPERHHHLWLEARDIERPEA